MATMSTLSRKLRELEQRMRQRRPARWATATHAEGGGPVTLRLTDGHVLTVAGMDEARRIALEGGNVGIIRIIDPNIDPEAAACGQ